MDEGQLAQYMAVADLVLDEGGVQSQAEVQNLHLRRRPRRSTSTASAAFKDESGKIIDDNPTAAVVAALKEPLSKIPSTISTSGMPKEKRYVPHGPFDWTMKNGGIEYLSGGNNYRNPGNLRSPFYAEDWGKKGVKRDGWYRFRIKAGAFAGEREGGAEGCAAGGEYGYGSPIEVVKSVVIDAPLDAPKEYEFLMYLQAARRA
jgi:hypothetical protein